MKRGGTLASAARGLRVGGRSVAGLVASGLVACVGVGCSSTTTEPHGVSGAVATATSTADAPAPALTELPPTLEHMIPLEEPSVVNLPVALAAVDGGRVVAVHDTGDGRAAWVAPVGADGGAGPALSLGRRHFVAAFAGATPSELAIAATEGRRLCLTHFDGTRRLDDACRELESDALVRAAGRLVSLRVALPEPKEDDATGAKQSAKAKPAPPKPKPKLAPRRKKKPKSDAKLREEATRALFASGRKLAVTGTWLDAKLDVEGEPVDSKLEIIEPMAGMALIGAATRGERIDLAFYEKAEKKGSDAQAKIGVARLDAATLVLDEPTRRSFGEGKLEAGFLEGHQEPRLWTTPAGSIVLGLRGMRGRCDVTIAAPFVMQMIPDELACGVDPRAFLALGESRRKGTPAPPPFAVPAGLDARALKRAPAQPAWDVGRSVVSSDRAFALEGEDLVTWGTGSVTRAPWPMRAKRSRLRWSEALPDGHGLAETDAGLVAFEPDGTTHPLEGDAPRWVLGPDRPISPERERRMAVRIGEAWVAARGPAHRIAPPAAFGFDVADDAAVMVGGAEAGLLLELVGGRLHVAKLAADGARAPLAAPRSPVAIGFDAVARAAGGAIVAGRSSTASSEVVAFSVGADGTLSKPQTVAWPQGTDARVLRLVALPEGGALLMDAARTRVAWLGDDGTPVATSAWPSGDSGATCIDGRPLPTRAPAIEPGRFVDVPGAAGSGRCITGDFTWTRAGSLRWAGSTTAGPHVRAELGDVPFPDASHPSAAAVMTTPREPAAPAARSAARPCPADMVHVPPSLCVDRFEGSLADATTGHLLSPHYASTPNLMRSALGDFATRRERLGDLFARALPLPALSAWQESATIAPVAVSLRGVAPSAFVTGLVARESCERRGRRLCKLEEWRKACKGEAREQFPYGPTFREGACNVASKDHPAAILHDNASVGHLDPRLNLLDWAGAPRPLPTGSVASCASKWGDDAIYDLVGNVDEWVDEKGGAFAGGFYARGTTNGCEAIVTAHPPSYLAYSTGVRCCADATRLFFRIRRPPSPPRAPSPPRRSPRRRSRPPARGA